jgi:5-hydroxyisourate hydrolase
MISTHILDLTRGMPASGVPVRLEKKTDNSWKVIAEAATNDDGRIVFQCQPVAGMYRLFFNIENYLRDSKVTPFFTEAPVTFNISDISRKYHIPLLLSPYGYSTYRGS